jgi:hypothetical protein
MPNNSRRATGGGRRKRQFTLSQILNRAFANQLKQERNILEMVAFVEKEFEMDSVFPGLSLEERRVEVSNIRNFTIRRGTAF